MASSTSLPHIPETQRLSPRVIRILGGNPGKFTLQGSNTYLIGTGPSRVLIDTGQGMPSWSAALRKILSEEQATISTALLTHWHGDHIGGVDDLLSLSPSTKIYKHTPEYKGSADWHSLTHGQEIRTDGATLRAIHCPGHTEDHVAFSLDEEDGAIFAGDNVLGHGTAVFEDLGVYMRSLHALQDACGASARVYPGHGEVVEQGKDKIREYISHREMREKQLLQVLGQSVPEGNAEGEWTPKQLVQVIYADVPSNLHLPAEGGLRQVLAKLEGDGKIVSTGEDGWRLVDESNKAGL